MKMAFFISRHQQCHITLLNCIPEVIDKEEKIANHSLFVAEQNRKMEIFKRFVRLNTSSLSTRPIVDGRVENGYPDEIILRTSTNYDLIIMLSATHQKQIKVITGSTAKDVCSKSQVPVLIIPAGYTISNQALTDMLLNIGFTEKDYSSIHQLINILGEFGTRIHCVKYCAKKPTDKETDELNYFNEYINQTYRGIRFIVDYVTGDDYYTAINNYISAHQIQLLAVERKDRRRLLGIRNPKVHPDLLYRIEVPILLIDGK
jgi:hypothetical protein